MFKPIVLRAPLGEVEGDGVGELECTGEVEWMGECDGENGEGDRERSDVPGLGTWYWCGGARRAGLIPVKISGPSLWLLAGCGEPITSILGIADWSGPNEKGPTSVSV